MAELPQYLTVRVRRKRSSSFEGSRLAEREQRERPRVVESRDSGDILMGSDTQL